MPKLIKHINFTESQAAKLLTPKGKELITNQLLEEGPQRISEQMTRLFENMADLELVNMAGAAALLYNDTLAGPIDYILSKEGIDAYYLCTRNHPLGLEAAKAIIKQKIANESPDRQQLLYFSIFGSLIGDSENSMIQNTVLTGPAIMTLVPYFDNEERYGKYNNFNYKPTPTDLMCYIREHLNMLDRPYSAVFSKPVIFAFNILLADSTTTFDDWIIQNIVEDDRDGFAAVAAEKLQGMYERLLDTIDWPII
jgi:hypothetical protein